MAVLDRLGATVSATEAPSSSTPNAGLAIKTAVRAATTGTNITLSGLQTIDGVALVAGDRVLVKDQSNQTQNGIYNVGTGNWAGSSDFQSNTQLGQGAIVFVTAGVTWTNICFILTTPNPITLGASLITWELFNTGFINRAQRLVTISPAAVSYIDNIILCAFSSAPGVINLPTAASRAGVPLQIFDLGYAGTYPITINAAAGETINAASSDAIVTSWGKLTLTPRNDGNVTTQWFK